MRIARDKRGRRQTRPATAHAAAGRHHTLARVWVCDGGRQGDDNTLRVTRTRANASGMMVRTSLAFFGPDLYAAAKKPEG